jgi:leader peptidase (prepilin peptidase) / N-methyltransferase
VLVHILLAAYVTALGLIVGSYLNVVVYRLPRGISTVWPRSRCGSCGAPIRAFDNLPVVSYLLLRGRCRSCGASYSWRYPAIEALTGLLFLACLERFGLGMETLAAVVFCCLLVALAAIDIEHMLLLDKLTLPGIALGILFQLWVPWAGTVLTGGMAGGFLGRLLGGVLGALLGGGILLAIAGGWYLLRKEEGMGMGDVKMLAMVGAFLGWKGVVVTLFASTLSGAVVGIALLWRSREGLKAKLPFGAFLALGALVALFCGARLVDAYLGLLR